MKHPTSSPPPTSPMDNVPVNIDPQGVICSGEGLEQIPIIKIKTFPLKKALITVLGVVVGCLLFYLFLSVGKLAHTEADVLAIAQKRLPIEQSSAEELRIFGALSNSDFSKRLFIIGTNSSEPEMFSLEFRETTGGLRLIGIDRHEIEPSEKGVYIVTWDEHIFQINVAP